jgi:hypothetical protein
MAAPPKDESGYVQLDRTPTGGEETEFFLNEAERAAKIANDSNHQDMGERKRYADNAYGITQAWIGFLIVMTIAQFSLKPIGMGLSESAFITVFTTTTASIFGFWLLVGNYLFRSK